FRHVYDLATEQAREGHDVGILCDSNTFDGLTETRLGELAGICTLGVHKTSMSRLVSHRDPLAFHRTASLARQLNCKILHGHGAKGGVFARMSARLNQRYGYDAYSFYTPHGGTLNYRPGTRVSRFFLNIEKRLLPLTDGLCFESQFAADKFEETIGKPECAVRIIPNGVRPEEFVPHVLNDDAADFVYLGELREAKGVHLLVDALGRLKNSHNATAFIVGDGPHKKNLMAQAERLGIADRVRFPGAMPAREAFKGGRFFVMPSLAESFPYVVLEAAAQGIPAIVTNVGGVAEITSIDYPYLIEANNVDMLSEAMACALNGRADLTMGTQALQARVREKFSTAGMAASVLDIYRSLTNGAGNVDAVAA
ncbi:MAG: glycosyltransferase family 4 protein, partial [Hyphomicrobiaceae bacterium]